MTEGKVERGAKVRLIRDNVVIHEGTLSTLKRFKDEVKEVPSGQECGMAFANYQDIRAGDVIECFNVEKVERTQLIIGSVVHGKQPRELIRDNQKQRIGEFNSDMLEDI